MRHHHVDQSDFRHAILDPNLAVPAGLTDGAGRPAGRRFGIYRNNVVASLCDALADGFPALHALMGADDFRGLALAYVRAAPPGSPLMMQFGTSLPDLLDGAPQIADRPWLADVARVDLAMRQSYHAADRDPLDIAALSAIAADRLGAARFTLSPALRLVRSDWPIFDIWTAAHSAIQTGGQQAAQPGNSMHDPARGAIAGSSQDVLVTRPGFDPVPHPLGPGAASFVTALAAGKTLGQAADYVADTSLEPDRHRPDRRADGLSKGQPDGPPGKQPDGPPDGQLDSDTAGDFDATAILALLIQTQSLIALELTDE